MAWHSSFPDPISWTGGVHSYEPYEPKRDMMDRVLHGEQIGPPRDPRQLNLATWWGHLDRNDA